jgi:hypothetical protein
MWGKFKRHRFAVVSAIFLAGLYFSILICEFLAPYDYQARHVDYIHAPPQAVHLFHDGTFIGPFVYGLSYNLNLTNLKREYAPDTSAIYPLRFLCRGESYRFWGLVESNLHLFCPAQGGVAFLAHVGRFVTGLIQIPTWPFLAAVVIGPGLKVIEPSVFVRIAQDARDRHPSEMSEPIGERLSFCGEPEPR